MRTYRFKGLSMSEAFWYKHYLRATDKKLGDHSAKEIVYGPSKV